MILYVRAKMVELNLSPYEFFETAYMWRFNEQGYITPDYVAYIQHGILPKYVVAFAQHLQQGETS